MEMENVWLALTSGADTSSADISCANTSSSSICSGWNSAGTPGAFIVASRHRWPIAILLRINIPSPAGLFGAIRHSDEKFVGCDARPWWPAREDS